MQPSPVPLRETVFIVYSGREVPNNLVSFRDFLFQGLSRTILSCLPSCFPVEWNVSVSEGILYNSPCPCHLKWVSFLISDPEDEPLYSFLTL